MLKPILRSLAFLMLCILLVYAPEILSSVSAPYAPTVKERILLRVTLSTEDANSAKSFYDALSIYMKQYPTVHLRVTRTAADLLFSQPDPQSDVFVFSSSVSIPANARFLPLTDEGGETCTDELLCADGETLLCAIHADTRFREAAAVLVAHLTHNGE